MTGLDLKEKKRVPRTAALIVIVWALFLAGCRDNDVQTPVNQSPFKIAVVSDIHIRLPGNPDDGYYDSQGNLANAMLAVDRINETHSDADFVAVTGDLVGCLFSEAPEDYLIRENNPAGRFKHLFDHLTLPYYVALGNHDYHTGFDPFIQEHMPAADFEAVEMVWKNVLGIDPYYSFIHKGIHMIFVNSNRGMSRMLPCSGLETETLCMGSFDPAQLDWLEACLNRPEPAVIFCHHPPAESSPSPNRPFWISMLSEIMVIDPADSFYDIIERRKDRILAIFSGHWHLWRQYTLFNTIPVFQTGPVGDFLGSGENMAIVRIDPVHETIDVTRHPIAVAE
jgi:3',5'-cyclic AMP phosphodiesterase CpdA